ncbi:hypothetical protein KFE25_001161 [Diacronema lutheri]|uniref:Exo-alpha-sialidase n=1 Tax=Diacronema lutheri TaxID=2081491 RepID=A0A8J6C4B2_DIALT|nr:hypothetical protein KFE25_001161 [Diacronema lutheri]
MLLPRKRAAAAAGCGFSLVAAGALLAALRAGPPAPESDELIAASGWANPRTSTVFDPDDDIEYPSYRVPAIASLGGETLLAFAEARRSARDDGPIDILVKRSDDNGVTWSLDATRVVSNQFGVPGAPPGSRGFTSYGNPTPIALAPASPADRPAVVLLFTVNETYVFLARTTDGEKWTNPVDITEQVKLPGRGRMATGPGHGVQLAHGAHAGRLLAPFNHLLAESAVVQRQVWASDPADARRVQSVVTDYEVDNAEAALGHHAGAHARAGGAASHHFAQREHVSGRIVDLGVGDALGGLNAYEARGSFGATLYSDDGGGTWHVGSDIPALGSHEHMLAELPSGEVISSYRLYNARGPRCRHFASSTDGGITWTLREQAGASSGDGGGCTVPDPQCEGSLASSGGWLYAASPSDPTERRALGLYASADGARSWRLVGRPNVRGLAGYSDLHTWPPVGVEPWPEIGVLFEHGPAGASAIAFTRAHLGEE